MCCRAALPHCNCASHSPRAATGTQSSLVCTDVEDGARRTSIFDPQARFYRNALTGLFSLLPVNAEL
ncbi:hypothetical protein DLM46_17995 [Paraburkholderia lacunae]|uniref:Uncharacterized protein n=1 Tax=Paraburkholderia lacunae TaxID=2211104 RepID=A0A370N6P1_9BURK|nr:hypothetical protein DLM46_17995 [Paraburkholderia lacunae]